MKFWHVLYTKPRNEKKVAERLKKNGFEIYCPLIRTMRQWSDRKKKVDIPMFPSYIFAHVEEAERHELLQDPGVLNYVYWLGKPAIVRDDEIEAIRQIADEGEDIAVSSLQVEKGQLVEIGHGPFKGMKGKIDQINKSNIVLYIQQLDCQVQFKYSKRFITGESF